MRELRDRFRKTKKSVVLFIDDAHGLQGHTLKNIKLLMEVVQDDGSTLSVVMVGHPKLTLSLQKPEDSRSGVAKGLQ